MKRIISALALGLLASACTHTYDLRPPAASGAAQEAPAKLKFSFAFQVASIDEIQLNRKPTSFTSESHEVVLAPGPHKIRFRYNATTGMGGLYTTEDTVLSRVFESGKTYELREQVPFGLGARPIRFKILAVGESFD